VLATDYRRSVDDLEVLTWPRYSEGAKALAQQVVDDDYRPDLILSIARGGLIIAGSLSYALRARTCT
jgi:hypoxanthine phosphoribosyltransferase